MHVARTPVAVCGLSQLRVPHAALNSACDSQHVLGVYQTKIEGKYQAYAAMLGGDAAQKKFNGLAVSTISSSLGCLFCFTNESLKKTAAASNYHGVVGPQFAPPRAHPDCKNS